MTSETSSKSLTDEQWLTAWVLCETAGDLQAEEQRQYVHNATVDPCVEERVIAVFDELASEPVFAPTSDHRIGETVGRYTLLAQIGRGGMGEGYAAEDTDLARKVAIKFLPSGLPLTSASPAQIIREARAVWALNHPNIVTVYEVIQTQWGLAIVMELVEGKSLSALINAGPLKSRQIVLIGRQIASALSAAHTARIVHRDVKPENVMARPDGYVKVMEFGLARKLREHVTEVSIAQLPLGTVRYVSPEQKRGEEVTGASDLYALGIVLEELGSWRHPLLASMHSAEHSARPKIEKVCSQLDAIESKTRSSRSRWAAAIVLGFLVGFFVIAYWKLRTQHADPVFKQVTRRSGGHDVNLAALSLDGQRLAFATVDGGLFVRDNQTAKVRELVRPARLTIYRLLFPPGGDLLLFGRSTADSFELWRVPLNGGPTQLFKSDLEAVDLSHDGSQLAWLTKSRHEVWTGSLSGKDSQLLFTPAPDDLIPMLFWSGDDKRIWISKLYGCARGATPLDNFIDLRHCDSDVLSFCDPDQKRVIDGARNLGILSGYFTTDGELLCLRSGGPVELEHLWSLRLHKDTGMILSPPQKIAHLPDLGQLTGSADGRILAVVRTIEVSITYVADWARDSENALLTARRLTLEETSDYPHAWTPDSSAIIFESDRNGSRDLYRQNLSSLEAEPIVSSPREKFMPQVSPDGKWLLFASMDKEKDHYYQLPHSLLRVPINGGELSKIPLTTPFDEFRCSIPGRGTRCVLRDTTAGGQVYYELDPLLGKGA